MPKLFCQGCASPVGDGSGTLGTFVCPDELSWVCCGGPAATELNELRCAKQKRSVATLAKRQIIGVDRLLRAVGTRLTREVQPLCVFDSCDAADMNPRSVLRACCVPMFGLRGATQKRSELPAQRPKRERLNRSDKTARQGFNDHQQTANSEPTRDGDDALTNCQGFATRFLESEGCRLHRNNHIAATGCLTIESA